MAEADFSHEKNHPSRVERDAAIRLFYGGNKLAYRRALCGMSAPDPEASMTPTVRLDLLPPPDANQRVMDIAPLTIAEATVPQPPISLEVMGESAPPLHTENEPSTRELYQARIDEAILEAIKSQGAHEPLLNGMPLIEALQNDPELTHRPRLQLRLQDYAKEAIAKVVQDGTGRHRAL